MLRGHTGLQLLVKLCENVMWSSDLCSSQWQKIPLTVIYLVQIWICNLLIRKYASQCHSEKDQSRNCTSIAEGTCLPVIIFYLGRIYRHLLRFHYYVWLNKCSHFNYILFNLIITWVSEIACTSLVYSFHACLNYLNAATANVSREKELESLEIAQKLKSQFSIFRIILSRRCLLLTH